MFVGGADCGSYARRQRSSSTTGLDGAASRTPSSGCEGGSCDVSTKMSSWSGCEMSSRKAWSWACTVGSDSESMLNCGAEEAGGSRGAGGGAARGGGRGAPIGSASREASPAGAAGGARRGSAPPSSGQSCGRSAATLPGRRAADPSRQSRMGRGRARWRLEVQGGRVPSQHHQAFTPLLVGESRRRPRVAPPTKAR